MNKYLKFLFALGLFGVSLTACNTVTNPSAPNDSKTNSTIPTYQGMTVSRSYSTKQKRNKEGDSGNHYGHEKHDDYIENDIESIVEIDVNVDEEIKYYVQPNEDFIIQVHLSNPNQFEIQSFTLNGKKYANYMFKDGSTMELLLLEVTAPATPGYVEYTIDAIKYIDGTDIKDVDMSKGDKSIKAGVSYTSTPRAEITSYEVNTTYVDLGINVIDSQNIIEENGLKIYLSDGSNVIETKELKAGYNNIRFINLKMSTTYQYGVSATFDYVDGRDLHAEWILKNAFTTLGAYTIKNLEISKTSIGFNVERIGETGTIGAISLWDVTTGEMIKEGDATTRLFDNLLSNHTYNLYVDFSYQINGETVTDWTGVEDIKTIAKITPTISFSSTSSDKTSISYNISTTDADSILVINKVELINNGIAIKDNGNSLAGSFVGLLSDNQYSLRVSYTYDLNDGQGPIANTITKDIKTEAYIAPVVSFTSVTSDKTSINYSISFEDVDNIATFSKVELIKGDQKVQDNGTSLAGSFSDLLSNNEYSIKASYTYD